MQDLYHLEPYVGFLNTLRVRGTVESYHGRLRKFDEYLRKRKLTPLAARTRDLAAFIGQCTYATATTIHVMNVLRSFYRYLVATEQLSPDKNPTVVFDIFHLRQPRRLPRPLDQGQREKLLGSLTFKLLPDFRASMVILLGLWEGMRRAEIACLTWDQVDFDANPWNLANPGVLTVKGKGEHERRIPMHRDVRMALYRLKLRSRVYFGLFPSKYVLRAPLARKDTCPSSSSVDRLFQEARAQSGMMGFTLHQLRHTFGTMLGEAGASAYAIRDLMGHSSIETSEIYVKNPEKDAHLDYDKVFGGPLEGLRLGAS